MPFPQLPYSLHPPLLSSQQNNYNRTFLRRKLIDPSTGCKYIALAFSVLFILQTFDSLHDAAKEAVDAVNHAKVASSLMVEAIFQILMYVILLLCLIMDLFVINTKKLSAANCFWRPGIIFFVISCGDHSVRLLNNSINSQYFFDSCRKDMGPFMPLSATIVVCDLQVQMNCIMGFAVFCRDMIASSIYVFSVHYYVGYLVRELKRQHQDTMSMDRVRHYQTDPVDHRQNLEPVIIHPRTANDEFMSEHSISGHNHP